MQTIEDFCSVNFFFSWGFAYNTSRNLLYGFRKNILTFSAKKFLKTRRTYWTSEKILSSRENSQPWEKFTITENISTLEIILNSRENSQLWEKFSTQEKILTLEKMLNSGENSQLRKTFSIHEKIFNSGENLQLGGNLGLRRKFSTQKKIFKSKEKYWLINFS